MNFDWLFYFADPTIDWDYAVVTLFVRFIGVFGVMVIMQAALQLAAVGVHRYEARGAAAAAAAVMPLSGEISADSEQLLAAEGGEDSVIAAIALALEIEGRRTPQHVVDGSSPWAMAGRLQQLSRTPRR
jgi:hypothetical protein